MPSPYTREDAARFLALAATEAAAGEAIALAIARAADDRLIGTIGLMDVAAGTAAARSATGPRRRRAGAAPRRARSCSCATGRPRELGLRELEILAHRDNPPSQRVAERAGFAATGEERALPRMPPGKQAGYRVFRWAA